MFRSALLSAIALVTVPCAASEYQVVVSQSTYAAPEWRRVVDALVDKHKAEVSVYADRVTQSLPDLQSTFPRYTCFVATPQEAGREFVADVHRMTRQLDDDPYTDTRWGILTGYDADNALEIATYDQPLIIRKVAAGTDVELAACDEGMWYDELVKNRHVRKQPGNEQVELKGPDDTTAALVSTLNDFQADLFIASGHATERNWEIGFRYPNGTFQCRDGKLFGKDLSGKEHPVKSGNPKVYMPIGNCLMGHIDSQDAMAVAWMNSAGVKQMLGYTVPTWYGYGGWGVLDYFVEQPGRYSYQEAFLANQHALIHRLNASETSRSDKRGLEFDSNVVAFYGDPAWDARMANGPQWFEQTLEEKDGIYTFTIKPLRGTASFDTVNNNGSQRGGRPFVAFLPKRLKDVKIVQDNDLSAVVTDDFILVPRPKTCDPNRTYQVQFTGQELRLAN